MNADRKQRFGVFGSAFICVHQRPIRLQPPSPTVVRERSLRPRNAINPAGSSVIIPSTPAAPLLRTTARTAAAMFPGAQITSIRCFVIAGLSRSLDAATAYTSLPRSESGVHPVRQRKRRAVPDQPSQRRLVERAVTKRCDER